MINLYALAAQHDMNTSLSEPTAFFRNGTYPRTELSVILTVANIPTG